VAIAGVQLYQSGINCREGPETETMPIITEVRFAHANGALADTFSQYPDITVSIVQETSTDPGRNLYFMRFEGGPETPTDEILASDSTVSEVEPMPGFEGRRMWGIAFDPGTKLVAPKVTDVDGFVLDARSSSNLRGWRERWLLPDREALREVWQWARENGFEFTVLEFRRQDHADLEYTGPNVPTEEQREALVAAYERGYFAEPRETSLEELAQSLGISPTAVAGRIKRGMKSTIEMTLVVEDPE